MTATSTVSAPPPHVRADQLFDFDVHHDPRLDGDLHGAYRALQVECPDIFYTTRHGGHWVVTRYDLIHAVMGDYAHFSNRELEIPRTTSPILSVPINLDPPEHTLYRPMLMRHFSPRVVAALDESMHRWAKTLIDRVYAEGECDFSEVLGAGFPVSVFMEMAGLPLDQFEYFRSLVFQFFSDKPRERHLELQKEIIAALTKVINQRMEKREDDLFSRLIDEKVGGRPLTLEELQSICLLLFLAGLDTVANMMTFTFHFLGSRPDLQKKLRTDPALIPDFIEEALRRFAVVNGVRVVKKDIDLGGAKFRVGDMVVCPLTLAGLDDRKNPDPLNFDIGRVNRHHLTFSTGPHLCLGHYLARAELRIFVEEFVNRIPQFKVADGFVPPLRKSIVMAMLRLPLEWPVEARAKAA